MQAAPAQAELFHDAGLADKQLPESCGYRCDFISSGTADLLLQHLWNGLPWRQQEIRLFGRQVMQPRLVCWQADPEVDYGYSGIRLKPGRWHPLLTGLRRRLRDELGLEFNSVLANAYRDGQDSMGWHADDEPELGPEPVLASISLGVERMFRWRCRRTGESNGMKLPHGSLLVLGGDFQRDFLHSIPKSRTVTGLRINLTFRRVLATVAVQQD